MDFKGLPKSESKKNNSHLNLLLDYIGILVRPNGLENCSSIEEGLKCSMDQIDSDCEIAVHNENISWKFVCLALKILKQLNEYLKSNTDEMLSITKQRTVRSCLEKVVCLELLPNLLPGVGLGLSAHTVHTHLVPQNKLSEMQKYEHICYVTNALLDLIIEPQFHDLLIPNFLGHILAALCQLAFVPFKKPQDNTSDNITIEVYNLLMVNKDKYYKVLDQLASKTYQPLVIKELMVIQGNKKCPKWLKREVSQLLNKRLIQPGGVSAIVRAITDASDTSAPTHSTQAQAIARLISTPHCKHLAEEEYFRLVCPQILEMLDSKETDLIRIAVECCRTLSSTAFEQHIFQPITKPLLECPASESDITSCIQRLHKCFAIPASDLWCLSVDLLFPFTKILFRMYCKVFQSVSHLRVFMEDLLWCVLSKYNGDSLNKVFSSLLFDDKCAPITQFPDGIGLEFGDEGGLKTVYERTEHSLEEFGDTLMIFLERKDDKGDIGNCLFVLLLKLSTDEELKNNIEKYLLTIKLLAVLSENSKVQQAITNNPEHIVAFIKSFIETNLNSCDDQLETICVALMVLTVVLNDMLHSDVPNWSQFQALIDPLTAIRDKTKNIELRTLAEDACSMIVTCGVGKRNKDKEEKQEKQLTDESGSCDEALVDACDPLLPVRGHAMMKLAKLIRAGDKQTMAKKETVLCIFQENLKHEDSFLYLTAIEGLSALAVEFPDTIMMSLIEEYACKNRVQPEVRLKVGETLVKVIRSLGELVPTYKSELLNAFLAGTRDEDPLVRASSLANLGDVCKLLGYRIGSIAAEILQCVRCIVQTDKALEPRRAAVMVITLLLKGLEKDALFVLQDVLKELYYTLKFIYNSDKDDVTKLHAQLALEELNSVTRAFFFPQQQLSRRIYVLDTPP